MPRDAANHVRIPDKTCLRCGRSETKLLRVDATWLSYVAGSSYYFKHALCYIANTWKHPVKQSSVKHSTRCTLLYEEAWHGSGNPFLWRGDQGTVPSF